MSAKRTQLKVPRLPKSNEMMEAYAVHRARGLSGAAAAREAGYAHGSAHVQGSKLDRHPTVRARVAELKAKMDERLVEAVTADRGSILRGIGELVAEARAAKDRTTAMRGLELLGRASGLFIERTMAVTSPLEGLNADQLLAIIRLAEATEAATLDLQAVPEERPQELAAPVEDAI